MTQLEKESLMGPVFITDFIDTSKPPSTDGNNVLQRNDEALLRSTAIAAALAGTAISVKDVRLPSVPKVTKKMLESLLSRYKKAITIPEVFWLIVACQMFTKRFANPVEANMQMSIIDSESGFVPDALNKKGFYGLMQLSRRNVARLSKRQFADLRADYLLKTEPVTNWIESIDPRGAKAFKQGQWPSSLISRPSYWQIPYTAFLWQDALFHFRKYFQWGLHGWEVNPKAKPVFSSQGTQRYMNDHPEIMSRYDEGKLAILTIIWKHGAPDALYPVKVGHEGRNLAYYNPPTIDHISPVVNRFVNLQDYTGFEEFVSARFNDI